MKSTFEKEFGKKQKKRRRMDKMFISTIEDLIAILDDKINRMQNTKEVLMDMKLKEFNENDW